MTELIKKALIIGCAGTFGSSVGKELQLQGWTVKGLMRDPTKKLEWLAAKNIIQGDCSLYSDLVEAVNSADSQFDLIVYGANPDYTEWQDKCESMLEPTARIAEEQGLHVLFPGNVYGYNPLKTQTVNEHSPFEPVTDKGVIRNSMENRLKTACNNGATVTLIRIGDFISVDSESSWLNFLLKKNNKGWTLTNPSPEAHRHTYGWLPDVAINAVALVENDRANKKFNTYHESGLAITHLQIKNALQALGHKVNEKTFPWWALKIIGIFNPLMKELNKMRYLWQQDLIMDGSKMKAVLGDQLQQTSLQQVMKALTIDKA